MVDTCSDIYDKVVVLWILLSGVNKYFQMAFIWDKFTESLNKNIQSEKIWEHLETMYNLEALDESESLPFPNDEKEFYLPESEFGVLLSRKEEKNDEKKQTQKGRETPKNIKEIKKEEKVVPIKTPKEDKDRATPTLKKEVKKEPEKAKIVKGRNSTGSGKEENNKPTVRRPTRNNQKADDSGSSGKGSPITVTPSAPKRRRL